MRPGCGKGGNSSSSPCLCAVPSPLPSCGKREAEKSQVQAKQGYHVNSKTVSDGLRLCPGVRGVQGSEECGSAEVLHLSLSSSGVTGLWLAPGVARAVLSGSIAPPTGSSPSPNQFSQSWALGLNRSPGSAQGRRDWTPVETLPSSQCARPAWRGDQSPRTLSVANSPPSSPTPNSLFNNSGSEGENR